VLFDCYFVFHQIGWHNDSGFLTALAGDMYVNHVTGEKVDCPDPTAGLYVIGRTTCGDILKVDLPPDCVAVQVGECTQIVTGGAVQATPHCVRGSSVSGIARISLPCFVDTIPGFRLTMPAGCTREQVLAADCTDKVPPLSARWESDDVTFGDFLRTTFAMYYDWKPMA
jgi:isopenicillin N synthase-like dioxygenase